MMEQTHSGRAFHLIKVTPNGARNSQGLIAIRFHFVRSALEEISVCQGEGTLLVPGSLRHSLLRYDCDQHNTVLHINQKRLFNGLTSVAGQVEEGVAQKLLALSCIRELSVSFAGLLGEEFFKLAFHTVKLFSIGHGRGLAGDVGPD